MLEARNSPYLPVVTSPEREEIAKGYLAILLDGLRELSVGDAYSQLNYAKRWPNIVIDGSVSAGKTTIGGLLENEGEFLAQSAGLFYRLITKFMLMLRDSGQINLDIKNLNYEKVTNYLKRFLENDDLKISIIEHTADSETKYCFFHPRLGRHSFSESELRGDESNLVTPIVAETPLIIEFVDKYMGELLEKDGGYVADGRTWYQRREPADLAVQLITSDEEAARRQTAKVIARDHPDEIVSLEQQRTIFRKRLEELQNRNEKDQARAFGQLLPVEEAVVEKAYDAVIDTTTLSPTEVTVLLLSIFFKQKIQLPPQSVIAILDEIHKAYGHAILAQNGRTELLNYQAYLEDVGLEEIKKKILSEEESIFDTIDELEVGVLLQA